QPNGKALLVDVTKRIGEPTHVSLDNGDGGLLDLVVIPVRMAAIATRRVVQFAREVIPTLAKQVDETVLCDGVEVRTIGPSFVVRGARARRERACEYFL